MTTTRQFLITLIATIALHAALPSTATAQASGGPDLITPAEARAMKQQSGPAVVFIDVRSRVEAAMRGTAAGVDYVVPYRELAHPVRWDNARSALAMVPNPAFVSQVQAAVKAQGATTDTPILLLCGSGTRAGQAATELRQAGFARVSVIGGGLDGSASLPGWRAAGQPTVASADEYQLFGLAD
jgi:rhodanese-related sulfurtransferase